MGRAPGVAILMFDDQIVFIRATKDKTYSDRRHDHYRTGTRLYNFTITNLLISIYSTPNHSLDTLICN